MTPDFHAKTAAHGTVLALLSSESPGDVKVTEQDQLRLAEPGSLGTTATLDCVTACGHFPENECHPLFVSCSGVVSSFQPLQDVQHSSSAFQPTSICRLQIHSYSP